MRPPLASVFTLFIYLPLETLSEGLPTQTAQLGDPCVEPGDCRIPNSQCVPTDNLYWNKQSFCVCQPGFHPSTGFCVADTGAEGGQNGLVKLENTNPQQPNAVTEPSPSLSEDTTRNTNERSPFITPVPGQNLLQGFHFGNRTQAIVSNIVEQLTHLRGPQQTDKMKQRLETLGLPLLQPPSTPNEEKEGATITTNNAEANGYSSDPSTPPIASTPGPIVSTTSTSATSSTTSSTPRRSSTPPAGSTAAPVAPIATTPGSFESLFPVPDSNQVVAQRWNSASGPGAGPGAGGPTAAPTMATVVTLKSSDNNSPFLPPELPPFFTKHHTLKATTTSPTSTTMIAFNVTTTTIATTPSPNDPEVKLAVLKKMQSLIGGPVAQPAPSDPTTPAVATAGVPLASKATPGPASAATSAATDSGTVAAQPTVPPIARAGMSKPPSHIHHPAPPALKQVLNNFSMPKDPPIPLDGLPPGIQNPPGRSPSLGAPPQQGPPPQPSLGSLSSPQPISGDVESSNQVRSTLVDRLPSVDFYAVFRSAAENVIREYLGGVLTTTSSPFAFPQVPQPPGNRGSAGNEAAGAMPNMEKMLHKFTESKPGPQSILGTGQSGLNPPGLGPAPVPKAGQGHTPLIPVMPTRLAQKTSPGATTFRPSITTPPTITRVQTAAITRPRHPFVWRSTSPGQASVRPLPRIVFTG